jgi:hypothetical protein
MNKLIFLLCAAASCLTAGSVPLISDTLQLSVGQYRYISFRVLQVQGTDTSISGTISVSPDTATVEYILLTSAGFNRWHAGGEADTLGFLEAASGPFEIGVPGFGDYILLVSNRGNYHPVEVAFSADLNFRGDGVQYDTLPTAFNLMLVILAAGVVVAAVLLAVGRFRK